MTMPPSTAHTSARSPLLWVVATLSAVILGGYQRLTGPTVSLRGEAAVAGAPYRYRLPRSGTSATDRVVRLTTAPGIVGGALEYRRFRTQDAWQRLPLMAEDGHLVARLPHQPAAGKLEYTVMLATVAGDVRLPGGERTVVMRFKDAVPAWLLIPHITLMFTALLVGVRAGLGALWSPAGLRAHVLVTLAALTAGGLLLGPAVQKVAFGQLWAGFPFGNDLTDDKTMITWLAWAAAAWIVVRAGPASVRRVRGAALAAGIVMLAVYLIPHSVRGSELDYTKVDQGVAPPGTVTTGN